MFMEFINHVKQALMSGWGSLGTSAVTVLNALGQSVGLIPDVMLAKISVVLGIITMIYVIQLHRKNIAKIEIETKLSQLKYDQQVLGRRAEDLE